jgi:putative MATE family efflux protein
MLSLPVLAGQLGNLLYNLVDTFFIALIDRSDPWLVGATGLVWPLFFMVMAVSFGIAGGVSSLVARAIGGGRSADLDRSAESGLFLGATASVLILAIVYPLGSALLKLFGGSGKILEYGLSYLYWVMPTVPFMLLGAVFNGILQGEGRTKHMMAAMMIGTGANIILDPVLIFAAGMGISGAALATAIGNALSFAYLLIVFLKTKSQVRIHWKLSSISMPVAGEIIRVGLPQSLSSLLASLSFIFYNRIMIGIDPYIMSAFTLYSRLEQIALVPLWSLSSGLAAVAGQAAGAGDIGRMRKASWTGSAIGASVCGSLLLAFVLSGRWLFRVFQSDPRVLDLAVTIAPWMAGTSFLIVPVFMATTVMSAAGFANWNLALTAVRIYGLSVPACFLGLLVFGKSVRPVMACLLAAGVLALGLTLLAQRGFFTGLKSGRLRIRYSAGPSGAAQAAEA